MLTICIVMGSDTINLNWEGPLCIPWDGRMSFKKIHFCQNICFTLTNIVCKSTHLRVSHIHRGSYMSGHLIWNL